MPLPAETLAALFEASPNPYIILGPDLVVAGANAAYMRATNKRLEDLLGLHLFEAFPGSPESQLLLSDSFAYVIANKQSHAVSFMRYDVPSTTGPGLEERYWTTQHVPVLDEDGGVCAILHHVVDVTELQRLRARDAAGQGNLAESKALDSARAMQKHNVALSGQLRRLRTLFRQAPGFMSIIATPDYVFEFVNDAYVELAGDRDYVGNRVFDVVPESEGQGYRELLDRVRDTGEAYSTTGMSLQVQRRQGEPLEQRYIDFIYQPIVEDDGRVTGIFVEGFDVTELRKSEDALRANEKQLRLMVAELNHRVKNTIAIILSIAARTAKQSATIEEFYGKYQSRLIALARTHDALNEAFWEGAQLREIAHGELRAYDETRFTVEGPDVSLPPSTAVSVGLCIHELASNAAKYGALSNDAGRVRVTWRIEKEGGVSTLVFSWTETGGPPVTPPTRRGFGSELIARSFPGPGESRLEFVESGVVCELRVKLAKKEEA
ncbi:MAG TPA: PAS domain-containing protein [Rhizomicrobium sp.]|jgi:two-component sensor histidine kinase|nr:PAS domain-containing protein [Rhizomicrobium sp.]